MSSRQQAHERAQKAIRFADGGVSWDMITDALGYASPASARGCVRYERRRQTAQILYFPVWRTRRWQEENDNNNNDFFPWPPAS
jgi:hypothetical protein